MTTINLYGGPLKRDIVQLAFEECGQAGYEFELTPEEYGSALRRLNAMMYEWADRKGYGIDLGYNFPNPGTNGNGEDESGIPNGTIAVVSSYLARRIAPGIGKTMGVEATAALAASFSLLRSGYATIPVMQLARQTPRGAGNKRAWAGTPFFTAPIASDEPAQ